MSRNKISVKLEYVVYFYNYVSLLSSQIKLFVSLVLDFLRAFALNAPTWTTLSFNNLKLHGITTMTNRIRI